MTSIEAARSAGWVYFLGFWYSTDILAILNSEHPVRWSGGARDLCLAHGVCFTEPPRS